MSIRNISMVWLLSVLMCASCSIIDEDNSDCGKDNKIDYQLQLVTNITTELNTQLNTDVELPVARALAESLSTIFTHTAHDVDLSFYGTDSLRAYHEQHIMDANQASYSIYLPVREYHHLAVANISDAINVDLSDDETAQHSKLVQHTADTIDSHTTGLFTARQLIQVLGDEDQDFYVELYMANAAAALVIDTAGVAGIQDLRIFASGFANSFAVRDSLYTYTYDPVVRSNEVKIEGSQFACHYTVNFPSRPSATRGSGEGCWGFAVYVTLADGSVTENIISVETPLLPAHLRVIKAKMKTDGSLNPVSQDVGVSVTLDWKQGGVYEPEL